MKTPLKSAKRGKRWQWKDASITNRYFCRTDGRYVYRWIKRKDFFVASNFQISKFAEKLSFVLHIWSGNSLMDILRDSQLVFFSHSTTFITLSYKSLAEFLFKLLWSSRQQKPEVALDFFVWPLCDLAREGGEGHFTVNGLLRMCRWMG